MHLLMSVEDFNTLFKFVVIDRNVILDSHDPVAVSTSVHVCLVRAMDIQTPVMTTSAWYVYLLQVVCVRVSTIQVL